MHLQTLFVMLSLMEPIFYAFVLILQIRKLRRELDASQEKVSALTTQLSANVSKQERQHTLWETYITDYITDYLLS